MLRLWAFLQPVAGVGFLSARASSRTAYHALVMSWSMELTLIWKGRLFMPAVAHTIAQVLLWTAIKVCHIFTDWSDKLYYCSHIGETFFFSSFWHKSSLFFLSVALARSCSYSSSHQVKANTVQTELGMWQLWNFCKDPVFFIALWKLFGKLGEQTCL